MTTNPLPDDTLARIKELLMQKRGPDYFYLHTTCALLLFRLEAAEARAAAAEAERVALNKIRIAVSNDSLKGTNNDGFCIGKCIMPHIRTALTANTEMQKAPPPDDRRRDDEEIRAQTYIDEFGR